MKNHQPSIWPVHEEWRERFQLWHANAETKMLFLWLVCHDLSDEELKIARQFKDFDCFHRWILSSLDRGVRLGWQGNELITKEDPGWNVGKPGLLEETAELRRQNRFSHLMHPDHFWSLPRGLSWRLSHGMTWPVKALWLGGLGAVFLFMCDAFYRAVLHKASNPDAAGLNATWGLLGLLVMFGLLLLPLSIKSSDSRSDRIKLYNWKGLADRWDVFGGRPGSKCPRKPLYLPQGDVASSWEEWVHAWDGFKKAHQERIQASMSPERLVVDLERVLLRGSTSKQPRVAQTEASKTIETRKKRL